MYKAQCPTCFEEAFDNQLRNNRIVDDIIEIFGRILDEVKSFIQEYGKFSEPPKKRDTGAFGKLSERANGPVASSYMSQSEVELSDHSDSVRMQNMTPVKESHQSQDHRRKVIPAMFSPRKKHNVAEKFVPCPVCNVDIPEKNINVHLDACLKRSENFDQHTSPTRSQKRKAFPKFVYSLLQDKELRKMLKQQGLSTHGDHKALISRHQRFTLLYNSENDSLNPRSTADIVKQIEREEQEEKKLCAAATSANKLKIDVKADPKLIEQAQQQYIQNNKTSFEKLIQSIRNRESEKKTLVKRKLVLDDEKNDSEDGNKEAQVQNVSGQKCTVRNRVINSDEEDAVVEKGYGCHEPCGSMSPITENVADDEKSSDETFDMNYEADTDESPSPVLGRSIVGNCSRKETEKRYEGELTDNLTPDMFGMSLSRSSTEKCSSAAQRDENSETGSIQSITGISQHTQGTVESNKTNTAPEIDATLSTRRLPKRLNSQHDDPDFEPYSDDTVDCFEIRISPVTRRRKNSRLSPQPSSSREGRSLRKRAKY